MDTNVKELVDELEEEIDNEFRSTEDATEFLVVDPDEETDLSDFGEFAPNEMDWDNRPEDYF